MPKLRARSAHRKAQFIEGAHARVRPSVEAVSIQPRITADEKWRLQRKIKRDATTNCWIWGDNREAYCKVQWRGRKMMAHRLLLELARGNPVSPDNHVHHKCGVPACVNPAHLLEVTPEQHREIHEAERQRAG